MPTTTPPTRFEKKKTEEVLNVMFLVWFCFLVQPPKEIRREKVHVNYKDTLYVLLNHMLYEITGRNNIDIYSVYVQIAEALQTNVHASKFHESWIYNIIYITIYIYKYSGLGQNKLLYKNQYLSTFPEFNQYCGCELKTRRQYSIIISASNHPGQMKTNFKFSQTCADH